MRIILLDIELKFTTSNLLVNRISFQYKYILQTNDNLKYLFTVQNLLLREFFKRDMKLFCLSGSQTTIRGITLY